MELEVEDAKEKEQTFDQDVPDTIAYQESGHFDALGSDSHEPQTEEILDKEDSSMCDKLSPPTSGQEVKGRAITSSGEAAEEVKTEATVAESTSETTGVE